MSFRLVSPDGDQVFELRRGSSLTVGRALTSDVPLLDPTVSRRHASLVTDDTGIELDDLGSSNGTFVNGERVKHARTRFARVARREWWTRRPSSGLTSSESDRSSPCCSRSPRRSPAHRT